MNHKYCFCENMISSAAGLKSVASQTSLAAHLILSTHQHFTDNRHTQTLIA